VSTEPGDDNVTVNTAAMPTTTGSVTESPSQTTTLVANESISEDWTMEKCLGHG
jgi:hypothetical protein